MVLAIMGLGTLAMIVLIVVAYAMTPVPSEYQSDATAQGSVVYYDDGKTPMMRLGRHRESVPMNKIPQHVQDSVLAAEDRSFYSEPGVSPKGIARAVWTTASGGDVTGGSTITQQMARNYYSGLSQERTVSRKFKEILISVRLGKEKPKSYILGTYLNTVYFGRQAYGIQAAARAYFGRDVSKLTVSQSAMLAAMIQQPAYFHTQGHDTAAQALRARWNYVLDGLVTMGKLTPRPARQAALPRDQGQLERRQGDRPERLHPATDHLRAWPGRGPGDATGQWRPEDPHEPRPEMDAIRRAGRQGAGRRFVAEDHRRRPGRR